MECNGNGVGRARTSFLPLSSTSDDRGTNKNKRQKRAERAAFSLLVASSPDELINGGGGEISCHNTHIAHARHIKARLLLSIRRVGLCVLLGLPCSLGCFHFFRWRQVECQKQQCNTEPRKAKHKRHDNNNRHTEKNMQNYSILIFMRPQVPIRAASASFPSSRKLRRSPCPLPRRSARAPPTRASSSPAPPAPRALAAGWPGPLPVHDRSGRWPRPHLRVAPRQSRGRCGVTAKLIKPADLFKKP